MPHIIDLIDVAIIGAGAAGLQSASHFQSKSSLRVVILKRSSASGGQICDVKLADGVEIVGLGAWKVDSGAKMMHELLRC